MSKLSDTQAIVLCAAAQRADGNLLPLPGSLRGGAAAKVVAALLARGLAEEQVLDRTLKADAALSPVWRNLDDGRGVLLRITSAGLEALGIEPTAPGAAEAPQRPGEGRTDASASADSLSAAAAAGASASHAAPLRGRVRQGTKQAALVEMLRRPEGATIAEIVAATGWQPHTRARRLRRGVEEAARAGGHVGKGRRRRAGLPRRVTRHRRHRALVVSLDQQGGAIGAMRASQIFPRTCSTRSVASGRHSRARLGAHTRTASIRAVASGHRGFRSSRRFRLTRQAPR